MDRNVTKFKPSASPDKQIKKLLAASGMLAGPRDENGKRSRDLAKKIAKAEGAKTAVDYAYKTGIYSINARRSVAAVAKDLLNFCRDSKRAQTIDKVTAQHIKEFMMTKLELKKGSFDVYCARLTKIDAALCNALDRPPQWREMISSLRESARYVLDNTKAPRAYVDPKAILEKLDGDTKLVAELQYYGGLRVSEATGTFTKQDTSTDPANPILAYRGITRDDLQGLQNNYGILRVAGKGGRIRYTKIPIKIYQELESRVQTEPFRVSRKVYGYALREAVTESGQIYDRRSTHGLRWNYAQERLDSLIAEGMESRAAMLMVSNELGHSRASITMIYQRRG